MRIWAAELAQSSSVPIDRRARPECGLVGVDLRAYGGYEKRRRERKVSAGKRRSSFTRRPRAAERACGARGTDGTRSEDRWRRARGRAGTGPSTLGRGVPVEPALRTSEVDDQRPRASPEVPGPGGGRGRGGGLGRPRHADLPYAWRHPGGECARAAGFFPRPACSHTMCRSDRAGRALP